MPELVEVDSYRRLAERALHREIAGVVAPDDWYLKGATSAALLSAALVGDRFVEARRIGKQLLLDTGGGATLGLHFGMSGRLVVDEAASIDELIYSSNRSDPRFDRFALRFADGGSLVMRDPRRLGGVELDPDESRLGPDALAVGVAGLRDALDSRVPLKARLMDQRRLAGVGNLIADETLWRASLSPLREARSLSPAELRRLHRHLRATIADLLERDGSHTGDLMEHRVPGGVCPRDGEPLCRDTVGGRTTWWCPAHQV